MGGPLFLFLFNWHFVQSFFIGNKCHNAQHNSFYGNLRLLLGEGKNVSNLQNIKHCLALFLLIIYTKLNNELTKSNFNETDTASDLLNLSMSLRSKNLNPSLIETLFF